MIADGRTSEHDVVRIMDVVTAPEATRPPKKVNRSARRQEILDTATAVFAEKGILAATVRDISERAGILSGSLYHHFASKEEMIAEILVPVFTSLVESFDTVFTRTSDPTEIIRRVIEVSVRQTADNPKVARILHQDEHHLREVPGLEELVRQRRAIRDRIEAIVAAGSASGEFRSDADPRVVTMTIFDVVLSAFRYLPPFGERTEADVAAQLCALILDGVHTK